MYIYLQVTEDRSAIKLCDFGLARTFDSAIESKTELKGAWRYMAPEVIVSCQYTTKADVFSYGKAFFSILRM